MRFLGKLRIRHATVQLRQKPLVHMLGHASGSIHNAIFLCIRHHMARRLGRPRVAAAALSLGQLLSNGIYAAGAGF